ncbi:elongation factor P [Candidatus Roizmanbacteria bacterium]|nr:elongation factor P [Candidatus Roizmanbacteria bacterium]
MKVTAGDLKRGDFLFRSEEIWQIQKAEFNYQGRGQAVVRIKIKSVASEKNIDITYKSNDDVEIVDVSVVPMQFLYKDQSNLHLMDEKNYQQFELKSSAVGKVSDFLKPGEKYYVLLYQDKPFSIRPPASVKLKVVGAENAVKGDTVAGAKKKVTLETGVVIMVPLFIKEGDTIAINPDSGEYVERVKS